MKKIFLFIAIAINILLLGAIFLSLRELRLGGSQIKKWRQKESEIKNFENMVRSFDEKKILTEHEHILKRIPLNNLVPFEAMKHMRDSARIRKLKKISFSYDENQIVNLPGFERMKVVPLRVSIQGDYSNVIDFITGLYTLPVIVKVTRLEVKRLEQYPNVEALVSVITFTLVN